MRNPFRWSFVMLLSNQLAPRATLVRIGRCLWSWRGRLFRRGSCRLGCGGRSAAHDANVLYPYRAERLVVAGVAGHACDLLFQHNTGVVALAEDGVPAVQMWRRDLRDEELRAVRARSGICHGEAAGTVKHQGGYDFVLELVSGIARAIARRIPALDHEVGNYSMKNRAVVKRHAVLCRTADRILPVLGAVGQADEVGDCFRCFFFKQSATQGSSGCVDDG